MNTKLHHGSILYIEQIEDGKKYETLNWHRAIKNETDMITLHVDVSQFWGDGDDSEIQVKILKDKKIDYLIDLLAKKLNTSKDEFYLKRKTVDAVIKYTITTLANQGIFSGAKLKVFKGQPEEDDEISLELHFVRLI